MSAGQARARSRALARTRSLGELMGEVGAAGRRGSVPPGGRTRVRAAGASGGFPRQCAGNLRCRPSGLASGWRDLVYEVVEPGHDLDDFRLRLGPGELLRKAEQ